jgi:hypothetical protein
MAQLTYNGVPLQIVHTLDFDLRPVRTDDDTDLTVLRGFLHCQCIWNPAATASNVAGGRGDRLGVSLANLKQTLLVERKPLVYTVGNDVVVRAPQDPAAPCDAWNGPKPLDCRVTAILGDKTAFVDFAVEFWVSDSNTLVLANRWSMAESLDEDFFATVTYRGRAVFRKDLLNLQNVYPDQFRAALIPPPDTSFQRAATRVQVTEDGRHLDWEVVDRQVFLSVGPGCPATRLEGNVTVGSDSPIRSVWDLAKKMKESLDVAFGFMGNPFSAATNFATFVGSVIPSVRASALVRVWGRPEALRSSLANIAKIVALDRLAPFGDGAGFGGGRVLPVSAYLTQSIADNYVEFRMEAFTGVQALARGLLQPLQFEQMMDLDGDITGKNQGAGRVNFQYGGNRGLAPLPANSAGSRGQYLGLVVSQLLGLAGQTPAVPAAPPIAPDLNLR